MAFCSTLLLILPLVATLCPTPSFFAFVVYVAITTIFSTSPLIEFFRRRSFPDSILSSAWLRVRHLSRLDTLTDSQGSSSSSDRVKLVLTFHPHNSSVRRIMLKHYSLLQSDPDTRAAFQDLPLVAYRHNKNLKDILVHSHLKSSVPDHFGTVRCSRGLMWFRCAPFNFPRPLSPSMRL